MGRFRVRGSYHEDARASTFLPGTLPAGQAGLESRPARSARLRSWRRGQDGIAQIAGVSGISGVSSGASSSFSLRRRVRLDQLAGRGQPRVDVRARAHPDERATLEMGNGTTGPRGAHALRMADKET
jgi:hypothetical protein